MWRHHSRLVTRQSYACHKLIDDHLDAMSLLHYNIFNGRTHKIRWYNFRKRSLDEKKLVLINVESMVISLKTQTVVHQLKVTSNPPSSRGVLKLYNVVNCMKGNNESRKNRI